MPKESAQHKLERARPPRVLITYDAGAGGVPEARELPLVIGVLGNFSGNAERPPFRDREFRQIHFDNFNDVLAELSPRATFKISSSLASDGLDVNLTFRIMEDFEPESLIQRIPILRQLREETGQDARDKLFRHLDRILHAPEFRAVEAAWRGLWYLISQTETSSQFEIKLLDVSRDELFRDLQRASGFDQSRLFKLIYEEPYGQGGADPFALLVGDFAFSTNPDELFLLEQLGQIASAAHAPFVAAAASQMLKLDDFEDLSQVRDLARVFDSTEFMMWRGFRNSEDARYVALTLPRILLRPSYQIRPGMAGDLQYDEDTMGGRHLLWGNAAFAFGACVANSFARYGWCGAIRGVEGGGLVEGLPTYIRKNEEEGETRCSVEVAITDRREKELADLGFMPLTAVKGTDYAVFFSVQSCARPRQYMEPSATADMRLSCQLSYILTASRFMHYLKVMARHNAASDMSRGDWERLFNSWISNYVLRDDQASPAIRAKFPLREARIEVSEDPGRPGVYRLVAFLRPYFQLDDLSVSLRLVGQL